MGREVQEEMKNDTKSSFAKSMTLLRNGLSAAINIIVGNPLFDDLGQGKGDGKARSKFQNNANSQRDSSTPERKKARSGTPTSDKYDKQSPVCNGCGRWISEKHTHETCEYIKKGLPGLNKKWETVEWKDSDAHRAVRDKVHKTQPGREGPFYLAPPKPQNLKDPGTKGTVCCNALSYSNPDSLPLIQGILTAKPGIIKERTERTRGNMDMMLPSMELNHKNNFENKGSQRLRKNLITIFIDTGSRDNFISTQYAES